MNSYQYIKLLFLIFFVISCSEKETSSIDKTNDNKKIMEKKEDSIELKAITTEFMRCIKERDKESFLTLFYNDKTPWLGKFDKKSEQITTENNPEAINEKGVFDITKVDFIDQMVNAPDSMIIEEKFTDLIIDTDGLVASINFDYEMIVNENTVNRGKEFWHLIKTREGWKITSVIYSAKY